MLDALIIFEILVLGWMALKRQGHFTRHQKLLIYILTLSLALYHFSFMVSLDQVLKSSSFFKSAEQIRNSFWFFANFSFFAGLIFLLGQGSHRRASSAALKLPVVGFLLGMWLYHPIGYKPHYTYATFGLLFGLAPLIKLSKSTQMFRFLLVGGLGLIFASGLRDYSMTGLCLLTYPFAFLGITKVFIRSAGPIKRG